MCVCMLTHVGWAAADVVEDLVAGGGRGGGGGGAGALVGRDVDGVVVREQDPAWRAAHHTGVWAQRGGLRLHTHTHTHTYRCTHTYTDTENLF